MRIGRSIVRICDLVVGARHMPRESVPNARDARFAGTGHRSCVDLVGDKAQLVPPLFALSAGPQSRRWEQPWMMAAS
jgi:hypothetical protein